MSLQAESLKVRQLIDGLQKDNPRLYQALIAMSKDIGNIHAELHPIISATAPLVAAVANPPAPPSVFTSSFGPFTVNFVWVGGSDALFFELRQGGTTFDDATFIVKTPSNGASIDALLEGAYTFRLKTINSAGRYSETSTDIIVTVTETAAPVVTTQVIDNNVLIYWTVPTSIFQIDHYNVYVDAVEFAKITSNFIARFEIVAGTFEYSVEAVDAAGNISALGSISAIVRQPPDFELTDSRVVDIGAMALVNGLVDTDGRLIVCIDIVETYQDHFDTAATGPWTTPQDQVDDAFSRWIQENLLTGSAQDEHDYGVELTDVAASVNFVKEQFSGTNDVVVTATMSISSNGVDWSTPTSGFTQFFTTFRYLRTKLVFTATDSDSMIAISNVNVLLNVKREVDANKIECFAADVNGTEVLLPGDFNIGHGSKTFKDIDSITTTPKSVSPYTAHFDFVDIPNPTHFFIYVFDSAGRRVDSLVDWKVKGIT
jgi:hypothetical protein